MHSHKKPLFFRQFEEWAKYGLVPGRLYIANLARRNMGKGQPELAYARDHFADRGKIFVDIGANKGLWSWVLAPGFAAVHAFEPNPKNFRLLTKWRRANVFKYAVALSDQDGTAQLRIPRGVGQFSDNMGSLQPPTGTTNHTAVEVATRCLDSYDLFDVGLIKIDVEGHEEAVLKGAWGIIERDQPVLIIEMLDNQSPLIERMAPLFARDYACYSIREGSCIRLGDGHSNRRLANTGSYCRDFIFLPKHLNI